MRTAAAAPALAESGPELPGRASATVLGTVSALGSCASVVRDVGTDMPDLREVDLGFVWQPPNFNINPSPRHRQAMGQSGALVCIYARRLAFQAKYE